MLKQKIGIMLIVLLAFAACTTDKKDKKPAFDISNMDLSVKPGDDFYSYANGNWIKNTTIPEDKSRYGSFDILQEENNKILKSILEKAANTTDAPQGSSWQKVGDFFAAGMDTTAIELHGLDPIRTELSRIENISNTNDLQNEIAFLHSLRVGPLFNISAGQDRKKSDQIIVNLYQGGLGLPDRDYYLSNDARSQEIRSEYFNHVKTVFNLMGKYEDDANKLAKNVIDIETRLANVSYTRVERRDPNRTKLHCRKCSSSALPSTGTGTSQTLALRFLRNL